MHKCSQTIAASALPVQIIDENLPSPSLPAHIVAAKHDGHLPLHKQAKIYARSGVLIARSGMAQRVRPRLSGR